MESVPVCVAFPPPSSSRSPSEAALFIACGEAVYRWEYETKDKPEIWRYRGARVGFFSLIIEKRGGCPVLLLRSIVSPSP